MKNTKLKYIIVAVFVMILSSCQTIAFTKLDTDNWEIFYTQDDEKQAKAIDNELRLKAVTVKNIFNPSYNKKVTIKIFPDLASYNRARTSIGALPSKQIGSGCCLDNLILLCSGGNVKLATHEYTHAVIHSIPTKSVFDSWIDESLCYYMAGESYSPTKYIKFYYDFEESNFLHNFSQNQHTGRFMYYVGQFLLETYSREQIISLLKTRSIVDGLEISEETFWNTWCNWVKVLK